MTYDCAFVYIGKLFLLESVEMSSCRRRCPMSCYVASDRVTGSCRLGEDGAVLLAVLKTSSFGRLKVLDQSSRLFQGLHHFFDSAMHAS